MYFSVCCELLLVIVVCVEHIFFNWFIQVFVHVHCTTNAHLMLLKVIKPPWKICRKKASILNIWTDMQYKYIFYVNGQHNINNIELLWLTLNWTLLPCNYAYINVYVVLWCSFLGWNQTCCFCFFDDDHNADFGKNFLPKVKDKAIVLRHLKLITVIFYVELCGKGGYVECADGSLAFMYVLTAVVRYIIDGFLNVLSIYKLRDRRKDSELWWIKWG